MLNKILISVIVPAYNVGPWIAGCIDSIINQTYKNIEIIIIDDGSTDDTPAILDEYRGKDPRIIVKHQNNIGLVRTRNIGIEIAQGTYIGFVDGDDTVSPNLFQHLLENAVTYNADISHSGLNFVDSDGNSNLHYGSGRIIIQNRKRGLTDLLNGTLIEPSLCGKLYKADLLDNSCIDPDVLNNEDLLRNFVLFSRANKSIYEDFCGYNYLQHDGSMSKNKSQYINCLKHIIKARTLIMDLADQDIYPAAARCWLSTYVNVINHNIDSSQIEIKEFEKECRDVLRKEKKRIHYLKYRQQVAAWLIIYMPNLHRIVYRLYARKYG